MESVDRSERAAGAAEKRRQAERARGLGPDAAAQLDQQMSSGPAPHLGECAENFGYNSRDRLRRELEKSRRDGTGKQTSPQFCTKHMHVCSSDQDRGCRSCFRVCHLDCRSELCPKRPCEFCLSSGDVAAVRSPACADLQKQKGCHACNRVGCWSSSPTCSGLPAAGADAAGTSLTLASSSSAGRRD